MKSIFCGNLEFDVRQSSVERLFKKFGNVERVDLKAGYAFIHMENERDAETAIQKLDGMDFGRKGQTLRVEWTRPKVPLGRPDNSRRIEGTSTRPSKTLFVANFDPINTRTEHIEKHFEQYGKIVSIRMRRHFAFVQFQSLHDAIRALEATHMSKLMHHTIFVDYGMREYDESKAERIDPNAGYAFVHMENVRAPENSIQRIDRMDFGRKEQTLHVEWTRPGQERVAFRRPDSSRRYSATNRPSKTLFVVNFDPIYTRAEHIERHFEQYGRIVSVRMRRHFAFVQFESLDDAIRALEATHMSKLMDHTIYVEFGMREYGESRNIYCPDKRWTERLADSKDDNHWRSPSPYNRGRGISYHSYESMPDTRLEQRDRPDHIHEPILNSGLEDNIAQVESSEGYGFPLTPTPDNSGQPETWNNMVKYLP